MKASSRWRCRRNLQRSQKYLEQECDIVYVGCSLKRSGSVNTGTVVARELMKEYPDTEIYCIDSLNVSVVKGLIALAIMMVLLLFIKYMSLSVIIAALSCPIGLASFGVRTPWTMVLRN